MTKDCNPLVALNRDIKSVMNKKTISDNDFQNIFANAVEHLYANDKDSLVNRFRVSQPTAKRWEQGKSAPTQLVKKAVLNLIQEDLAQPPQP